MAWYLLATSYLNSLAKLTTKLVLGFMYVFFLSFSLFSVHIPEASKYVQFLFESETGAGIEGKENFCLKRSTVVKTCCITFFKYIVNSSKTLF